jgi:hypothetical protein
MGGEETGEFHEKIGMFINKFNFRQFSMFLLLLLAKGLTSTFKIKPEYLLTLEFFSFLVFVLLGC